jgi:hypothetical protein
MAIKLASRCNSEPVQPYEIRQLAAPQEDEGGDDGELDQDDPDEIDA